MIKEISSVNNSYIKELLSLRDKNIRIEKCKFIVEGYHLVEEAYRHNMLISVLSTDENSLNTFNVDEKYKSTMEGIALKEATQNKTLKKVESGILLANDIHDGWNAHTIKKYYEDYKT
jgi:TrmH family RNA methyltransferase